MITRLRISHYRGIAELDTEVGAGGLLAKGKNTAGKTTLLKAIRAGLAAQDIGPDAIRNGADKSEILIDLDHLAVRRAISRNGSSLSVTHDIGNGVKSKISAPQSYLTELLGTSPIDPLDIFMKKAKERRTAILAALPVIVSVADLRRYVPDLPDSFDCTGHGLEVVARLRQAYYDTRTEANAEAKARAEDLKRAREKSAELVDAAGDAGGHIPQSVEEAEAARTEAENALVALDLRASQARQSEERMVSSRRRVEELRLTVADQRAKADETVTLGEVHRQALDAIGRCKETVDRLEEELIQAKEQLEAARDVESHLQANNNRATAMINRASELEAQAVELEATIAEALTPAPTEAEIVAAKKMLAMADDQHAYATKAFALAEAKAYAEHCAEEHASAQKRADDLDEVVKKLTNDAPAELLAASNGIPGLRLDGDIVYLDDVSLDGLSSAEQLKFAVEIARRANAKSKILVCDGLERIDPEQFEQFVKHATADGYQLIASRVDKGELVLEAIEP